MIRQSCISCIALVLVIASIIIGVVVVECYQQPLPPTQQQKQNQLQNQQQQQQQDVVLSNTSNNRRSMIGSIMISAMAVTGLVVIPPTSNPAAVAAVLRSKGCIQGEGDGCSELAGENELIKTLQQRSAANRERNEREALDAFYMKNYPDYFTTVGKFMIKKSDGSGFVLVSDQEYDQLIKENKLSFYMPNTKGGKFTDLTQKPIAVLKE